MDKYLMMLYVTLDQERALKQFFIEHGWLFSKPDLCVTTDKLGPLLTLSTSNTDQSITTSEHSINVPVSQTVGTKSNKKRKNPTKLSRSPASKQSKSEQSLHNVGDLTLTKTHHGTILTRSSNTSQSSDVSNLSKINSQSVKHVDDNTSTTPSSSSGVLAHEPCDTNVDFPLTLQCSNQEQVVVKLENVEDIEDEELEQPVHQMNQSECSEMENVDECSEIENVDNNEDNDPEDSNDFSDNTMEHHDDTMNEVLGLGAALDTDSKSTMLKPFTSSKQVAYRKRKLKTYSLQQKYDVLIEVEKGERRKTDIAKELNIKKNTLSTWLKQSDSIKRQYLTCNPKMVKMRGGKWDQLERLLIQWHNLERYKGAVISSLMLRDKAKELACELGLTDFMCSSGWCERFKQRHGLKVTKSHKKSSGQTMCASSYDVYIENLEDECSLLKPPTFSSEQSVWQATKSEFE